MSLIKICNFVVYFVLLWSIKSTNKTLRIMLEKLMRFNIKIDKNSVDYGITEKYKVVLDKYDGLSFGYGLTFIFDFHKHAFFYMSKSTKVVPKRSDAFVENMGYKTIAANVHYDDIVALIKIRGYIADLINSKLNIQYDKLFCKFTFKIKLLNSDNMYSDYYMNVQAIELDNQNNVWLILGKCIKSSSNSQMSPIIVTNTRNGVSHIIDKENLQLIELPKLSDREREILKLIASNKNETEVASMLDIGISTVKSHKKHLFEKLYADSTSSAIEHAELLKII